MDLAEAHVLSLEKLLAGGASDQYNVGTGTGHSVLDVVRAVEDVTERKVPREFGPRRDGDPAVVVADSRKLRTAVGWQPRYSDLADMVATAWAFERRIPSRARQ